VVDVEKRLAAITDLIPAADPLSRVQLIQERMDLEIVLGASSESSDLAAAVPGHGVCTSILPMAGVGVP